MNIALALFIKLDYSVWSGYIYAAVLIALFSFIILRRDAPMQRWALFLMILTMPLAFFIQRRALLPDFVGLEWTFITVSSMFLVGAFLVAWYQAYNDRNMSIMSGMPLLFIMSFLVHFVFVVAYDKLFSPHVDQQVNLFFVVRFNIEQVLPFMRLTLQSRLLWLALTAVMIAIVALTRMPRRGFTVRRDWINIGQIFWPMELGNQDTFSTIWLNVVVTVFNVSLAIFQSLSRFVIWVTNFTLWISVLFGKLAINWLMEIRELLLANILLAMRAIQIFYRPILIAFILYLTSTILLNSLMINIATYILLGSGLGWWSVLYFIGLLSVAALIPWTLSQYQLSQVVHAMALNYVLILFYLWSVTFISTIILFVVPKVLESVGDYALAARIESGFGPFGWVSSVFLSIMVAILVSMGIRMNRSAN